VIRLLIADDQALVRGALSALLGLEPDIEVVAEVGRGDEVVDAAVRAAADVALLDIEMPGWTGSRRHPRCAAPCRPAGAHRDHVRATRVPDARDASGRPASS
jgi:DNA-binding NarL/FixJ family response regulator